MARWFRFYSDAMRHPKVAKLSDKDFRLWCDLLCVASDRDGAIPCLDDLKHVLKRRLDHLSTGVERLISAGLIEPLGCGYAPHGWREKQYKSDVSTDRVKRYREKRNVSETPPDTETDSETDTEKNTPLKSPRKRWVDCPDDVSPEVWRDWRSHRKTVFTDTALRGLLREADKAGWTAEQAICEAIERGWQGFKAEWVKDRQAKGDARGGSLAEIGDEVRRLYGY